MVIFMSVSVAFCLMYCRLFLFGLGSGVAIIWICSFCVMDICNSLVIYRFCFEV